MDDGASFLGFLVWYLVFIVAITFHEAAHAFAALWGGDDTAYMGGQVSLDPIPHIRREPIGTVLLPIATYFLSGFMLGWASAPYNPVWARRYPHRAALMSAAGPAANLLLVLLAFLAAKISLWTGILDAPGRVNFERVLVPVPSLEESHWANLLATVLSVGLNLNLLLFLFNLIPLPPLDGSGILGGIGPRGLRRLYDRLQDEPMLSLLCLAVAWKLFSYGPFFSLLLKLLHPGHRYGG